jgi:hypothetical protein
MVSCLVVVSEYTCSGMLEDGTKVSPSVNPPCLDALILLALDTILACLCVLAKI